jgi:2-methylcitrate dehydratase PrpD
MAADGNSGGQISLDLARHILSFADAPLGADVRTAAKHCILDWFAVTLAGLTEPAAQFVREDVIGRSLGRASIVGTAETCAAADAALANGTASHALDYDDVHITMLGHPTVAVFSAALAVAEEEGSTGEQLLRAFIAGYDAAVFVGTLAMPSHYERGFHSTATIGSFGAAAACGLLLGLDAQQMAMALGLAGTQAAGLKSMFGTMAKPLHAGKAASNGVLAARLAKRGFTANPGVLEVPQGFIATQSDNPVPPLYAFPERGACVLDTLFKYHAACYLTHSTIEAVETLCRSNALTAADIAAVAVHVPAGHLKVCNILEPDTGLGIKFSLRHTAAFAAAGVDTARIESYSDAAANDPALVALRSKVAIHDDYPAGTGAKVEIRTGAGTGFTTEIDVGVPERDLDRQGRRLTAKFHSLTEPVIGSARGERLHQRVETLDRANDLRALTRLD